VPRKKLFSARQCASAASTRSGLQSPSTRSPAKRVRVEERSDKLTFAKKTLASLKTLCYSLLCAL
ncbi:MAG: hypothetical protein IJI27_01955, partial [Oscillospiraceae bacterium]|nr:hypothetical protein [Oscillospiraceae bacterium]